jgi:hypothetical protein
MLKMLFVALLVYGAATEMPTPDGFTDPTAATAAWNAS